ncbi:putative extracellular matrix protein FRAS1 [Apostichopus japonicus]|uniref:Putative extracellular matrix protein FRAS1 n=1 Tax=Stichopus japonicus TaxID=307972 RepID=A0A2G8L6F6_STIJA|nr:putative extracellular matrix protein FRAS1 [Apostichopus japonicus]
MPALSGDQCITTVMLYHWMHATHASVSMEKCCVQITPAFLNQLYQQEVSSVAFICSLLVRKLMLNSYLLATSKTISELVLKASRQLPLSRRKVKSCFLSSDGLQCFDCVNTPMTECKKVICAEGEICVAQNIFSVFGNNDIVQACIDAKSQSADGDVCITDLDVLIELEIIPLEIASLFAGTLILCDSNLCNSQARLQDTCSPRTSTSAPVEFLDSCYFDSADGGVIEHGETFSSGCGDCVCNDGDIQCSKGKCPDLICAVGIDFGSFEFCEDDSFCLFLTEVIPGIGVTLNTGECILKSDWPHNNDTTGPLRDGNARVCSQNFCNLEDIIPVVPDSCDYNGRTYSHLEAYNPDECNTCTCVGGTIKCTRLPCSQGEAVFCGDSSQAPELDQCTASYSPLEQYLVGAASAQEVCTIAVRTITPPTTTSSTVSPTSTPDSGERTTRSGGTSSSCITEEGNQLKDGETSTVGPCQWIDVIITFKVDYDLIKDSLKEFEREFIDAMSLLLRVPRDDVVVNEVNDGDLQVEHKGMKLMADSLMISVEPPSSPSSTKPTFYVIIAICCALSFLILIIGTVCIASAVMRRKSEGREKRLSKRSNHTYDVPPLEEHEPGDKEAGKDNVVSNPYHRSMDLDEAPPSYHRSIGAEVTPQEQVAEAESAKSSSPYLVPMSSDGKVDASSTDLNEDPSDSNALDNPVY